MRSLPGAKCFVTGSYLGGKLPVQRLEGEGRGQSSLWSEQCELSVWRAVSGSEPHQQAPQAAGPWRLGRSAVHAGLVFLLGQLPRAAANQSRTLCPRDGPGCWEPQLSVFHVKHPTTCILAVKLGSIKGWHGWLFWPTWPQRAWEICPAVVDRRPGGGYLATVFPKHHHPSAHPAQPVISARGRGNGDTLIQCVHREITTCTQVNAHSHVCTRTYKQVHTLEHTWHDYMYTAKHKQHAYMCTLK